MTVVEPLYMENPFEDIVYSIGNPRDASSFGLKPRRAELLLRRSDGSAWKLNCLVESLQMVESPMRDVNRPVVNRSVDKSSAQRAEPPGSRTAKRWKTKAKGDCS
jgi:hypothetical protein